VAEAVHPFPRRHGAARRWYAPSPASAFAIRFGVAVCAAIWIGKLPGLVENNSQWILITVMVLMQQTAGAAVLKGLLRCAGTLAGALIAIPLFGLFAQEPPLLMAALFLTQAVAAYGFSGRRFQYAWFVWAFTTAVVLGGAIAGEDAVETIAFQRACMVGIGILLVFLADSLIWPARAEPLLRERLGARARRLGNSLRLVIAPAAAGEGATESPNAERGALANQLALLNAVRAELGVSRAKADALERVAILLEALDSRARLLAERSEGRTDLGTGADGFDAALTSLAQRVEGALDEVAAALTDSRAPAPLANALEFDLLALESAREPGVKRTRTASSTEVQIAQLRDLVAVLRALQTILTSSAATAAAIERAPRERPALDPFRTNIAVRTGIAVVVAFLVPAILGWPLNATVAPIAFLLAAVPTRGGAVQTAVAIGATLTLAWLVADVGSIYVAPHTDRIPLALVPAFVVASTFAYLSAKQPKLAILTSVGGLVALLPVYGAMSAPTNVYGPYSTVCYMALAVSIGWLCGRLFFPATASQLFRQRVAALLELCLDAVQRRQDATGTERGPRLEALTRGWAVQSAQLGALHGQARFEPVEFALDQDRREQILALAADLMDAVRGYHAGTLGPTLERGGASLCPLLIALQRADEALLDSMRAAVAAVREVAEPPLSGLSTAREAVEEQLEGLRAQPEALPQVTDEERRRLLVELDGHRRLALRQQAIETWLADWRSAAGARA
jgi:uncharacterized membrane protein YccC